MKFKVIILGFAVFPMLAMSICFDSDLKKNGKQQIDALVKTALQDGRYLKKRTFKKDRLIEKNSRQNCEWTGIKVSNIHMFDCKITGFCTKLMTGEYCVGVTIQFEDAKINKKFNSQRDRCFNIENIHPGDGD